MATPHRMSRTVSSIFPSMEQDEGIGARVQRSIGGPAMRMFDPFLMLDEFRVGAPAGFPDHPHRGFETDSSIQSCLMAKKFVLPLQRQIYVTYLLSGSFQHEDFCGHKGIINAGDVQWMTAGRGIVHCEMPHGEGISHGLQLWINLRKEDKMVEPKYQELLAKDIPEVTQDGVKVRIIAGEAYGVQSKVYTRTPTIYLDFKMEKGSHLLQFIPPDWNSFVYILEGKALFGPDRSARTGQAQHIVTLNQDGDCLEISNKDSDLCHFVLLAGQPLKEKVVQHGPFVMNSQEEIREAISDYQQGRNGFENAKTWTSSGE